MTQGGVDTTAIVRGSETALMLFDVIGQETSDVPGVTRVAYGEGEAVAFARVAEAATEWDAQVRFDPAGNQFITLAGTDRSREIVIGSHMDSVPHGGNFDGTTGVLLGIALQASLVTAGKRPPFDLTVACLRAEESCWFPHSYIGSKTALGLLDPVILDQVRRSDTGLSLAHHMQAAGFDPEAVRDRRRLLDPERVVAYIEPHIEQAPLLLHEGLPLGIVTGIRGSFRYRDVSIEGEYAHSGAMPQRLRKDTVFAAARLIAAMEEYWFDAEHRGEDLTVTFGKIATNPEFHSFSKIPGEVQLCADVRSQDQIALDRARTHMLRLAGEISRETGVQFDFGALSGSEPALMSEPISELLAAACKETGTPIRAMPSGAGHDAATFALAGVPASMIFLRNSNGSHNPDEHMDMADFDRALTVLYAALQAPAGQWPEPLTGPGRKQK